MSLILEWGFAGVNFSDAFISPLARLHSRLFAGKSARATHGAQRFSRSTGSRTSCTLKYFASAGYFAATASYMA
jgi:hypothetical protein